MNVRFIVIAGLLCSGGALALAALDPTALRAWLAAAVFWAGLPLGALILALMIRFIPGPWQAALGPGFDAVLPLLALTAVSLLPVLTVLPAIYPWAQSGYASHGYLTPWFFALRSLVFLAVAGGLAFLLLRPGASQAWAIGGLIALLPLHTMAMVDWLLSLDPAFHSSGFGLYVLAGQVCTTLAAAAIILPGSVAHGDRLIGLLLFVALQLWAYLSFMQYVISWSDNLPASAAWYARRSETPWNTLYAIAAAFRVVPLAALLFAPLQRNRRVLRIAGGGVLIGQALETLWLVLPGAPLGWATVVASALGLGSLGLVYGGAGAWLERRAASLPREARA